MRCGADMPEVEGVDRSVEVIKGVDGNDVTLYVHRPAGVDGPLPGVLHLHGGGMVLLEAAGAAYVRWRDELAAAGHGRRRRRVPQRRRQARRPSVPGRPQRLRRRRCGGSIDNRAALGISKLIVSGESGGGNLTLATTLKAKRDGLIEQIDGVYAQCPYISNAYAAPLPELTSLYENDGYFLELPMMGVLAEGLRPDRRERHRPAGLAVPRQPATTSPGLPPHVISVNQLDPLRDEGLAYYRKLLDAGVSVGQPDGQRHVPRRRLIFAAAMPDVYPATIRDIKGFADSL